MLDAGTLVFWNPRRVMDLAAAAHPDDPAFSANAITVLARRYLRHDPKTGHPTETPRQLLRRVASVVAASETRYGGDADYWTERFYSRMASLQFLPNSPTLMNAGGPLGNLAACFTLPVGDSLDSIFQAVKETAIIQQTGGGVGFTFTHLRPAGDVVATTDGVASGPVSFMNVFDNAAETIKQGGRRRGAMMGILAVDHPDILQFVTAKSDPRRLTNFNVSVGLTDEFMAAVERSESYWLRHPRSRERVRPLRARKVWDLICNLAWSTAEPGVLFVDRIESANPTPQAGQLEATNPCSELPLLPYESCVLGSLNLAAFVSGPAGTANSVRRNASDIDWPRLREGVHDGVRFLDDVIDASRYPLPAIDDATRANRKIGLGVMGWADLLVALGVPYDSEAALELADRVMGFVAMEARQASEALARERGPFPLWSGSALERAGATMVRNATQTCVAPTGTISILAGCSGGIEPIFALVYYRRILEDTDLEEVHPAFREALTRAGSPESVLAEVAQTGSARKTPAVPEAIARLFPTAYDVAPEWHVRMQAAFQKHIDNAVSKTVNLPHEAAPSDVARAYLLAYQLGCKGVTVYRDGSRAAQVLNVGRAPRRGATAADDRCPECQSSLELSGTCSFCRECGYSLCR